MSEVAALDRTQAEALHGEIVKGCQAIRQAWIYLAGKLYDFHAKRAWESLGFATYGAWLRSPEVELHRSHADLLVRAWRELVIDCKVEPERLRRVDLAKINCALPAIRGGARHCG